MVEITCIHDAGAQLGEATIWDPDAAVLWWIDIWGQRIFRTNPASGRTDSWETPEYPGCIGLRKSGGLVLTMRSGFYFFDPETAEFTAVADPESHLPDTRFNDGKPDRQGRFWSGTMFEAPGKELEFIGSLYRMDTDLTVHRMIDGIGCSNGLAWSPDSTRMYFSDSHTPVVNVYDFDAATGEIENGRTFIEFTEPGDIADGTTVDAEGCYWVTIPFKGRVDRYDPDGIRMASITMPTDLPTCCEFGGPDLDVLYVTTAVLKRPMEELKGQTSPGGLFALDVGVKGLPLPAFEG
ncbi:SMP-30/gluconolactonase/LRE family protein [Oricola indica]|jgi:L-arabinonolactonase|uniref:SMP-30/gluconolactonase/LRE family protein n=1 Tax=Oricola indica TaxID=2872591 RepID=UPI001CBE82E5|nr:SMP-30/gluconolactonase/LRE family protein [Oricola indica]